MEILISLLIAVVASVISHLICKWRSVMGNPQKYSVYVGWQDCNKWFCRPFATAISKIGSEH